MENSIQLNNKNIFAYRSIYDIFLKTDRTEHTIKEYSRRVFTIFNRFLDGKGLHRYSLIEFKKYLEGRINSKDMNDKLSVNSANLYLTSVKCFLKTLHDMDIIPIDITKNVKCFRQVEGHRRDAFSNEDIHRILNHLQNDISKDKNRNLCMFYLLINNGLRIKEIAGIQYEDINFADKSIRILGKGRIQKETIYVSDEIMNLLNCYCSDEKFKMKDYIFYSRHHKYIKAQYKIPLSNHMINYIFTSIFISLGIKTKTKTVHSTRHFYFTTLTSQSDLKTSQIMILGRLRSINTIINYTHEVDKKELWHKSNAVLGEITKIQKNSALQCATH